MSHKPGFTARSLSARARETGGAAGISTSAVSWAPATGKVLPKARLAAGAGQTGRSRAVLTARGVLNGVTYEPGITLPGNNQIAKGRN